MFKFIDKLLLLLVLVLTFWVLAIAILPAIAGAQTSIAVDINKAKFTWEWAQGAGDPATQFRIKCNAGVISAVINDITLRVYPVKTVVTSPGKYSCVIVAENTFGSSGDSNTVTFDAGNVPVGATNFTIEAQ